MQQRNNVWPHSGCVKTCLWMCSKIQYKGPWLWTENKFTGPDWFPGFLKRNTGLSFRQPEALRRAPLLTKEFWKSFYNTSPVRSRCNIPPRHFYNTVETVLKPHKIVASEGKKWVTSSTSAERGEIITKHLREYLSTIFHFSQEVIQIPFHSRLIYTPHSSSNQIRVENRRNIWHFHEATYFT